MLRSWQCMAVDAPVSMSLSLSAETFYELRGSSLMDVDHCAVCKSHCSRIACHTQVYCKFIEMTVRWVVR
jgi:hypothetical protein